MANTYNQYDQDESKTDGQPPPQYAPGFNPKGSQYPAPGQANYYPPPAGGAYPAGGGAYPAGGGGYPAGGGGYPAGGQAYQVGGAYAAHPGQVNIVYSHDEVAMIQDYMIPNIIACICCCWCIGIAAILKSNECQKAKQQRDVASARQFSTSAKKLLVATIVTGIVVGVIGGVIRVILTLTVNS